MEEAECQYSGGWSSAVARGFCNREGSASESQPHFLSPSLPILPLPPLLIYSFASTFIRILLSVIFHFRVAHVSARFPDVVIPSSYHALFCSSIPFISSWILFYYIFRGFRYSFWNYNCSYVSFCAFWKWESTWIHPAFVTVQPGVRTGVPERRPAFQLVPERHSG